MPPYTVWGEVDLDIAVVDWDLATGWNEGEYSQSVDGKVGIYGRLYTTKGGNLEVLAGVDQPVSMNSGNDLLSDDRVYRLRVRKPY